MNKLSSSASSSSSASGMDSYIVDYEALHDETNHFVVKEMCISSVSSAGSKVRTWVFLPPFPKSHLSLKVQQQNNWVTRNLHGISWDQGEVPYSYLSRILTQALPAQARVMTKGLEKALHLQDLLGRDVCDLDNFNCPPASELCDGYFTGECIVWLHRNNQTEKCAYRKCAKLAGWCYINLE